MRQHNAVHGSTVNATHPHIAPNIQPRHIVELRLQLVGGAEKVLLASDDEDPQHKNCQCRNDKSSQPRRSRHMSSYECLRNSLTNSMSLFCKSSKLPSITTSPSLSRARRSAIVFALCRSCVTTIDAM